MNDSPENNGMIRVERRSALPFWTAAAVWVLWAIALPMYLWYHYLICAVVSASAGFITAKLAPTVVTWEKAQINTGNPKLDDILIRIGEIRSALAKAESAADDPSAIRRISTALTGIGDELTRDPSDIDNVRRLFSYYLPTIEKLAEKYVFFKAESGEIAAKSASEIEAAFGMIAVAMEKLRDSLLEGDALDISTDIDVLENILKQDGLN